MSAPNTSDARRAGWHFLAGAIGGSVSAVVLSPLDIVRTRMQSVISARAMSRLPVVSSISGAAPTTRVTAWEIARSVYVSEGFRGFYRGLLPTIVGVGPARAMYFGAYSYAKRLLGPDGFGLRDTALHLTAATSAGVCVNTAMSPWWVIRIRLQLQDVPAPSLAEKMRRWLATVQSRWSPATGDAPSRTDPRIHTHAHTQAGEHAAAPQHVVARSSHGQQLAQVQLAGVSAGIDTALPAAARTHTHAHTETPALTGSASAAPSATSSTPSSRVLASSSRSASGVAAYPHTYTGVWDCAVKLYKEEGVRAFFRGLSASYLGVAETALQFTLYSAMKKDVIDARLPGVRASHPHASEEELRRLAYTDAAAFVTSSVTKLVAAAATYPHEVIRTRLREQHVNAVKYRSIWHAVTTIVREEGVRALYGGLSVHLLRTVPNAAILLVVVEKIVGGDL